MNDKPKSFLGMATKADIQDMLNAMEHRLAHLIRSIAPTLRAVADAEAKLKISSDALKGAVDANTPGGKQAGPQGVQTQPATTKDQIMPNPPILDALTAQVAVNTSVEGSAQVLIDGFAARQQAAIDAAIANGATAEQLAPIQAEVDALTASSASLAASVAANTTAAQAKKK